MHPAAAAAREQQLIVQFQQVFAQFENNNNDLKRQIVDLRTEAV